MISRRAFLAGSVAVLTAPCAAEAQQPAQNSFRFELEEAQNPFRGRATSPGG